MKKKHSIPNKKISNYIFLLLLAVSIVIVLLVQFSVLNTDATCFDDEMYLKENMLVKNPSIESSITFLKEVLVPSDFRGYYQPLSMISLMIDYSIAKTDKDLYVYHRTSLILHLLNTILIAIILFVIFKNYYIAVIMSLIFGIHPMTVETLAWVGERKTTLAAFFALISILTYIVNTKRPKWYYNMLCAVMLIFSLLSKPIGIMLPIIFLLMDFWPLERIDYKTLGRRIIEKIPFFIISFVSAIITYLSQKNTATVINPTPESFLVSIYKICYQIFYYMLQMIYPYAQTPHYPIPTPFDLTNLKVLIGVLGAIALIVFSIISLKKTRVVLTGLLIFLVLLLPTSGVIGFTFIIMSDKYAYIASFGVLLIISAMTKFFWDKSYVKITAIRVGIIIGALTITAVYSGITRDYFTKWSDTATLYKHMINLAPYNSRLYSHLGRVYYETGNIDEAIKYIKSSLKILPKDSDLFGDLGNAYASKGDIVSSIQSFKKSVELNPDNYRSQHELGSYLNQSGQFIDAIKTFTQAVQLYPLQEKKIQKNFRLETCYYGLALAQFQVNRDEEGIYNVQKSINSDPNYFDAYYLLANYYNKTGDYYKSLETYQRAKKSAYSNLKMAKLLFGEGIARRNLKEIDKSIDAFKYSIELNPKFVGSIIELSNNYVVKKMYSEAFSLTEKAISEFDSSYDLAVLHNNLGYIRAVQGDLKNAVLYFEKSLQIYPEFIGAKNNLEHLKLIGAKTN